MLTSDLKLIYLRRFGTFRYLQYLYHRQEIERITNFKII